MKQSKLILLTLFIALAVILNFIPHLNYPYPLHVDEWVHYQFSNHLSNNASLYFGQEYGVNLEVGFHYLLSTLNSIGINYLIMFNFFASLVTIFICLGVFVLARRIFNETAGVFAVLFIAILKSSVMILGPVFFVPMAIGLFFIAAGLFLIKIGSKAWVLILASLLITHPPSAVAFLLLSNIEFVLIYIKKRKGYFRDIVYQFTAGLIALPLYLSIFTTKGIYALENLKFIPISGLVFVPRYLNWLVVLFVLIGIYSSVEKKKYSLALYSAALLAFIFIFYNYKIEVFIPYARALMYLFLVFSVLFGFGAERSIHYAKGKRIKFIVVIALILFILYIGISAKIESKDYFYNIINNEKYKDFIYIKDNTDKNAIVLADPWVSDALTPIAERKIYSRIVQAPSIKYEARNNEIKEFFNGKCKDIEFLKENNISIVYDNEGKCDTKELNEIRDNIYFYKA